MEKGAIEREQIRKRQRIRPNAREREVNYITLKERQDKSWPSEGELSNVSRREISGNRLGDNKRQPAKIRTECA